uniref:Integrase catalytic domain-containing protein n=1 Tax=Fagus sylvatica TaxID=28930 RepID=A0A2N9ICK3_FAGSY
MRTKGRKTTKIPGEAEPEGHSNTNATPPRPPTPPKPEGKDSQLDSKIDSLEEKIRLIQGLNSFGNTDFSSMSWFPNMTVPPKFKAPEFEKYNGRGDPMIHLQMYCRKMAPYADNEPLLIQTFQDTLTGNAAEWYSQLKKISHWKELADTFLAQYGFNSQIAPDRFDLQRMEKKSNETFREYAQRWREKAARARPPLDEREMIKIFVDTLKNPYFDRMMGLQMQFFVDLIPVGDRIEDALKTKKIVDMTALMALAEQAAKKAPTKRKEGDVQMIGRNNGRPRQVLPTFTMQPIQPRPIQAPAPTQAPAPAPAPQMPARPEGNQPNDNRWLRKEPRQFTPLPMPMTELYPILIEKSLISPIVPKPYNGPQRRDFNPNSACDFHFGEVGHTVENCGQLRHRVQDLIDHGVLKFEGLPNITTNPLPKHPEGVGREEIPSKGSRQPDDPSEFDWYAEINLDDIVEDEMDLDNLQDEEADWGYFMEDDTDEWRDVDLTEFFQFPYLIMPPGFVTPEFEIFYYEDGDPEVHLQKYGEKMALHLENELLMISVFPESLSKQTAAWFYQLRNLTGWDDLVRVFLERYRFNPHSILEYLGLKKDEEPYIIPDPGVAATTTKEPSNIITTATAEEEDAGPMVEGFEHPHHCRRRRIPPPHHRPATANREKKSRRGLAYHCYSVSRVVMSKRITRKTSNDPHVSKIDNKTDCSLDNIDNSDEEIELPSDILLEALERQDEGSKPNIEELEIVNLANEGEEPREVKIGTRCAAEQKEALIALLREFHEIFAWSYQDMPGLDTDIVVHKIPLKPECKPVKQALRRMKPEVILKIKEEVEKQLKAGFLSTVTYSDWVANIVPVPKKDGKQRTSYSHSWTDSQGYNQIKMAEEDKSKTAFVTHWGTFVYDVMPFGLKNAGATYQRAMVTLFHDMIHHEIEVYVDDMIAKSRTAQDHLTDLRKLFQRLKKYQLRLNPNKCAFGVTSGKLLGFIVSGRGIEIDPAKVQAIRSMPAPKTEKEIRSFLGRNQLYSSLHRTAYGNLRASVQDVPSFYTSQSKKHPWAACWDNKTRLGRKEQAIYYLSKKFTEPETRYLLVEKTCCALAWASKKLRQYMLYYTTWLVSRMDPIKRSRDKAIADYLADYPSEQLELMDSEFPDEDVMTVEEDNQGRWKLYFDGAAKRCRKRNWRGLELTITLPDALATLASLIKLVEGDDVRPLRIETRDIPAYCVCIEECMNVEAEIDDKPWYYDIKRFIQDREYPSRATENEKKYIRRMAFQHVPSRMSLKSQVTRFVKNNIICRYGMPEMLITDNASNLNNRMMDQLCQQFKIQHHNSAPYRPKMNGAVEAANKNVKKILSKMTETYKDWHEHLPYALCAYRTSVRTSVGATPYSLVYGMEAVLPVEVEIPSLRILSQTQLGRSRMGPSPLPHATFGSSRAPPVKPESQSERLTPWHKEHSDGLRSQDHILRTQARLCARPVPLEKVFLTRNKLICEPGHIGKKDTLMHDVELSDRQEFIGVSRNPDRKTALKRTKNTPAQAFRRYQERQNPTSGARSNMCARTGTRFEKKRAGSKTHFFSRTAAFARRVFPARNKLIREPGCVGKIMTPGYVVELSVRRKHPPFDRNLHRKECTKTAPIPRLPGAITPSSELRFVQTLYRWKEDVESFPTICRMTHFEFQKTSKTALRKSDQKENTRTRIEEDSDSCLAWKDVHARRATNSRRTVMRRA